MKLPTEDLCYLATPYSKYPGGIHQAFVAAASLAARLLREGVKVYSPIAHTHPLATFGDIDPLDHAIWLPFDEQMMHAADFLAVAMMHGWCESRGISHEIAVFTRSFKPIFYLDPATLEVIER